MRTPFSKLEKRDLPPNDRQNTSSDALFDPVVLGVGQVHATATGAVARTLSLLVPAVLGVGQVHANATGVAVARINTAKTVWIQIIITPKIR